MTSCEISDLLQANSDWAHSEPTARAQLWARYSTLLHVSTAQTPLGAKSQSNYTEMTSKFAEMTSRSPPQKPSRLRSYERAFVIDLHQGGQVILP